MGRLYNLKHRPHEVVAANGAVAFPDQGVKVVFITKGTAAAITLTAPVSGANDGCGIVFISTTAAAHTVTLSTLGFNAADAAGDVGTFGAAIGNGFECFAYGGEVYTANVTGVTFA